MPHCRIDERLAPLTEARSKKCAARAQNSGRFLRILVANQFVALVRPETTETLETIRAFPLSASAIPAYDLRAVHRSGTVSDGGA
jgi:hypothetical protein